MKKIFSLILVISLLFSLSVSVSATNFTDTYNIPQAEAIDVIETLGIVEGYGNGVFAPNNTLTRAELCTMLTRALYGDPIYTSHNAFTDVAPTHWAVAYINTANAYGIMTGYGDGRFGPDDKITYTQMAAVIMKALGYDCDKMSWPAGVNSMGQTLGLFDNVPLSDYAAGCTRAHAAQMIYNAFELNYVNHKADYPVTIKGTTFLKDGLGFEATVKAYNGHQYIAYINLDNGDIHLTGICLTSETAIYPVGEGAYRFANSSKSYAIKWPVPVYVNGEQVMDNGAKLFAACDKATGVFDQNGKLLAIYIYSTGIDYVYQIHAEAELYEIVKNDKNWNANTSTVTYFAETGEYVISNKVDYGWITGAYKSAIYLDNIKLIWDNDPVVFSTGDFVKVFYNYRNEIVAIVKITEPMVYDMTEGVYHTTECGKWNDYVNHHYHNSIEEIRSCEECVHSAYDFKPCGYCHARTASAHNGKDITIVK